MRFKKSFFGREPRPLPTKRSDLADKEIKTMSDLKDALNDTTHPKPAGASDGSPTLQALFKHWTVHLDKDSGVIDLPFNVEEFCREVDVERSQLRGEIARLTAALQSNLASYMEAEARLKAEVRMHAETADIIAREKHSVLEENGRLRGALERITKLFHAAHDNNGSAMDAVGEMAAVARKALAGRGAEEEK